MAPCDRHMRYVQCFGSLGLSYMCCSMVLLHTRFGKLRNRSNSKSDVTGSNPEEATYTTPQK